jgi:hypothetical protein
MMLGEWSRPSNRVIGTMLANLHRGNTHLILERVDESVKASWYVQVLLRDGNTYQLEYRDGVAAEDYQTRTVSQEKVLRALLGWATGKTDWQDDFMWNNIGSQFGAGDGEYQG